ncbi:SMP-30/gluconolactonase/LRE family protein [Variovorax sp. J22R133]|uniref:SMP-30/gluconolactonase/LRE family protein n=1 Tax=Variovorax brevis TaxID=3053503 RepID=UPI0025762EDB|nr:SMP-30/gluconolactonase/LRE family protein [Variovorax sp. J22R133]MDM0117342.1 SMP-30/gluconolactonase/LRE family protein [Variovorax sp. J22R133]
MPHNVRVVVHAKDQLGETPLWCPHTEKIWWIDIERPKLQSFDERTGQHDVHRFDHSTFLGSLALHRQGGFVVALDNSLHRFDPSTSALKHIVDVEAADKGTRLNDGRCDHRGRLWIGTMDAAIEKPLGSFYRVEASGSVQWLFDDIIVTNSVTTSPDDRTLYMSDTRRFKIWAFDLDPDDGVLSNRRVFADYAQEKGRPDGAVVDSEGCLWNAVFAGHRVIRYTPAGKVDRVIELPVTNPTCVCFGGPDLSTLYVTTATKMIAPEVLANEPLAGALLAVDVGVKGLPEAMFG